MLKKRSARTVAALLLALAIWGGAANRPAFEQATSEQAAPAPQRVADPGGSSTGNGG